MPEDVSRQTEGVLLPFEISDQIWQSVQERSAAMRLASPIDLPGGGVEIPIISGDPVPQWVGETQKRPVDYPAFASKKISGYTLSVIVPFSKQFRRDKKTLYNACVKRLPGAIAKKFDSTVFGPVDGLPGANFDTLNSVTAVPIATNTYDALVTADSAVATADGILTGWAISPQARKILLMAKDNNGRPLLVNNIQSDGAVPALLGAPTYQTKGVYLAGEKAQIGFAGDWEEAYYGIVEDITISISDQATLDLGETTINLWQQGMFAVMVEFEAGFRAKDLSMFVKLTN